MRLTIAPAPFDDPAAAALVAASVLELDGRYGGEPWSGAIPQPEQFVAPSGAFLLARLDGEAVGCGVTRIDGDATELKRVYVAPGARGRGVGKALLQALLDAAAELGCSRVRLETGERMPEARALLAGRLRADPVLEPVCGHSTQPLLTSCSCRAAATQRFLRSASISSHLPIFERPAMFRSFASSYSWVRFRSSSL
jgi:GNAT superfamily N-acetyltransferase